MMLDLFHKLLYTGIGVAAMTEQKAKDIVAEMEKRGEVSSEEGKKLVQDMMDKARKQTEDLRNTITDEINKVAGQKGWPAKDEFEKLQQRVNELDAKVAALETKQSQ